MDEDWTDSALMQLQYVSAVFLPVNSSKQKEPFTAVTVLLQVSLVTPAMSLGL